MIWTYSNITISNQNITKHKYITSPSTYGFIKWPGSEKSSGCLVAHVAHVPSAHHTSQGAGRAHGLSAGGLNGKMLWKRRFQGENRIKNGGLNGKMLWKQRFRRLLNGNSWLTLLNGGFGGCFGVTWGFMAVIHPSMGTLAMGIWLPIGRLMTIPQYGELTVTNHTLDSWPWHQHGTW